MKNHVTTPTRLHLKPGFKTTGSTARQYLLSIIVFVCLACFANETKAQNNPNTIFKDWSVLGESANHIDVSYRVVKCGLTSPNQLHLSVFNENATTQSVNMTISVKNNANNATFSSTISYSAAAAAIVKADCSGTSLKVDLPSSYDPNNLTVTVTFN